MENQQNKTTTNKPQPTKPVGNKPTGARTFAYKRGSFNKTAVLGFEEKVVKTKRISKTTKGGRRMRFSVLVVVGNKKGQVGIGLGKATEIPNAIRKAIKNAHKSVVSVLMNKRHTLYHEITGKCGASKVLLKPAPDGTGIIAGGVIRAVVELAGYKDIYTKNKGSNASINMAYATINGLTKQRSPSEVLRLRGIVKNKKTENNKE
jgi:small subunit ribosomal protein S5